MNKTENELLKARIQTLEEIVIDLQTQINNLKTRPQKPQPWVKEPYVIGDPPTTNPGPYEAPYRKPWQWPNQIYQTFTSPHTTTTNADFQEKRQELKNLLKRFNMNIPDQLG